MKSAFEELSTPYVSGSQTARVQTERWVSDHMYCINCGSPRLNQFPNNSPLADFFCPKCQDQYEVKSTKNKFGARIVDGAYFTKIERLQSATNPNLLLIGYDASASAVRNVCIVPKHFFTPDIIERRKPLAATARRAGWIGSNILLGKVPEAGRIFVFRDGAPAPKDEVLEKWRKTLFEQSFSPLLEHFIFWCRRAVSKYEDASCLGHLAEQDVRTYPARASCGCCQGLSAFDDVRSEKVLRNNADIAHSTGRSVVTDKKKIGIGR